MPTSLTLVLPLPPVTWNIPEPLSPPPTIFWPLPTQVWQSCTILVPETPVLTQVLVTVPSVHPVVRPTLSTGAPTGTLPPTVPSSTAVMVKLPTMSRE